MADIAFWTGASGMRAYQSKLDVTAHNVANVNTYGYKARRAAFDDLIRNRINTNVAGNHLVGHGVKQEYVDNLMNQSSLDQTGYPLDFAITGAGFFAVDNRGEIEYTRNGAFDISTENGTNYLATNDGAYVLDAAGQRIALEYEDGVPLLEDLSAQLGVYNFDNPYGLESRNSSRYVESANSGAAAPIAADAGTYQIVPQALERSSVDLATEMTEIINAQRAFQLNSRVVTTADAIADELNNLR